MDTRRTPKAIRTLIQGIKSELPDARVVLFGSHARGDAGKWSDYDLLVISSSFAAVRYVERARVAYRYRPRGVAMDVICLTPEEYKDRVEAQTLVTEAAREGVELIV